MPSSITGSKRSQCMALPIQLHSAGSTDAATPSKNVLSRAGTIQESLSAQPTNAAAKVASANCSHARILATHWNCGRRLTNEGRSSSAITGRSSRIAWSDADADCRWYTLNSSMKRHQRSTTSASGASA